MAEYISKKDILQMIESTAMWNRSFSVLYEDIEDMKPANVSPVRHGRWVMKKTSAGASYTVCSHCNSSVKYNDEYGTAIMNLKGANYCPNCGARMDEEVKHER